jgi:PPP family 3-phenylpropionic acid transporter
LAFIATNLVGGRLLDAFGAAAIAWWCAIALAIPLFAVPLLPEDRLFTIQDDSHPGSWRALLHDRRLLMMMTGSALLVASHAMANNFLSIQWLARGATGKLVGFFWASAMASEVIVLWFAQRWLRGRSPLVLALAGAVVAVFRWIVMAFNPDAWLVTLLQLLQGISGTAPILAVMLDVQQRVPPKLTATAQGGNAVLLGAAIAVTTLASGFLWRIFGIAAYGFMAVTALMGLWVLCRAPRQDRVAADHDLKIESDR